MPGVGTTHDIMLGGRYWRLTNRGYRKRPAPLRGARISTGDYGYGDLSVWQRWHQHCWNGGMGADKWVDDAMYDYGVGVNVTDAERLVLSPDLTESVNTNLLPRDLDYQREYFTWEDPAGYNRLYCISYPGGEETYGSTLYKYVDETDTWTVEQQFDDAKKARAFARFAGNIVIGFRDGTMMYSDDPSNNGSWTEVEKPAGTTWAIQGMGRYSGRLYVAYRDHVYRYKPNFEIDGDTEFYDAAGGGAITEFQEHLGFLYMGSRQGILHRTDGNQTFSIWSWDGGIEIIALRSFDGRLFVGTYEYSDDRTMGHQGIYQFTGSAVTQLKRWGQGDKASAMGKFTVYARRLYYGAPGLWGYNLANDGSDRGGFGVAVFDPIEDAHSIWSSNKDSSTYPDSSGLGKDWLIDDVKFWQGYLHASVRGFGNFRTRVKYRRTEDEDGQFDIYDGGPDANAGYLKSSNYDAGTPGLEKLWRDVVITGTFPVGTSATSEVSIDGGKTWTVAGTVTGDGGEMRERFFINLRSNQLCYRLSLNSTDVTKSPVVTGHTVSYLPIPEPNWLWDVTISLSENVQLMDRTVEQLDVQAALADLSTWFREQRVLDFIDRDLTEYHDGALIWDYNEDQHIEGNAEDPFEAVVRLTLLEVVQGPIPQPT